MKQILTIILLTLCTIVSAGTKDPQAKKVLDTAANKVTNAGGIKAMFTVTSLVGKEVQGTTSGTMYMQGRKFQMTTPAIMTWFDGKTQWSMQQGDTEVSMTEPTNEELQDMNPYAFINIYKKGYDYKMSKGTLINGTQGYKITLTAENPKKEIKKILVEIDQKYNPVRVSALRGKNTWTRLVITDFSTGHKLNDADFRFPSKDYPKARVIDLR